MFQFLKSILGKFQEQLYLCFKKKKDSHFDKQMIRNILLLLCKAL